MKDDERRLFAVPALTGQFNGIELSFLDRDDEHDRTILVLAEHPELRSAIESGRDKIYHHGRVVNPQLHLAMHEIVANQLLANDPPEMWDTAKRLSGAGYERHEVLHMLASVVSGDVYSALHDKQSPDPARTRSALAALPGPWERQREQTPAAITIRNGTGAAAPYQGNLSEWWRVVCGLGVGGRRSANE